jgi:hypothetical protein
VYSREYKATIPKRFRNFLVQDIEVPTEVEEQRLFAFFVRLLYEIAKRKKNEMNYPLTRGQVAGGIVMAMDSWDEIGHEDPPSTSRGHNAISDWRECGNIDMTLMFRCGSGQLGFPERKEVFKAILRTAKEKAKRENLAADILSEQTVRREDTKEFIFQQVEAELTTLKQGILDKADEFMDTVKGMVADYERGSDDEY